jgi:transposase
MSSEIIITANMNKYYFKHIIKLSEQQKIKLQKITSNGNTQARVFKRALILLKSNEGLKDKDIAEHVKVNTRTVQRVRKRCKEQGLNRALYDAPRPGSKPVLDNKGEAHLIAVACSSVPKGHNRWTLELLQERLIADKIVTSISLMSISNYLKAQKVKPWREKNVVRVKD